MGFCMDFVSDGEKGWVKGGGPDMAFPNERVVQVSEGKSHMLRIRNPKGITKRELKTLCLVKEKARGRIF